MNKLLGFLLIEGLLTNVGGLLTLISSVPNIIVGNAAGISFVEFFLKASPYVILATTITIWMGGKVFGIERLATESEKADAQDKVAGFDEDDGLGSQKFFWFGTIMTGLFILAMATASITPYIRELGLGYVALAFAAIMLTCYKATANRFYQAIDWDLLAFFGCLFIVINMMEHALVLEAIGEFVKPILALGELAGPAVLLVVSAVASSVTDNIPLAAMLAKILGSMNLSPDSPYWWAVIFGANLGGNITPIGSASTLVAVTLIHKFKIHLSFADFVKRAVPLALIQLIFAAAYVLAFMR